MEAAICSLAPLLRGEGWGEGSYRESNAWIEPLIPTFSPQERGEGEEKINVSVSRHNSSACRNHVAIPYNFQKFLW